MAMGSETSNDNNIFAGRYRIIKLLGEGGMGKVYLAEDQMLGNERLALKLLNHQVIEDEKQKQRFLREVKLARQVTHPNILRTYDFGCTESNQYFFSMEYAEGTSLKDYLKQGLANQRDSLEIMLCICDGLAAMHTQGVIHRDLKPANIIITSSGEVKISDFGVATIGNSDITKDFELIGSGPYMAPECWTSTNVSSAADIYALGVIAYEMFTGILPLDADSAHEMMFKHLETAVTPMSELVENIPLWLNQLILKMLSKKLEERPGINEIASTIEKNIYEAQKKETKNEPIDSHLVLEEDPTEIIKDFEPLTKKIAHLDPAPEYIFTEKKSYPDSLFKYFLYAVLVPILLPAVLYLLIHVPKVPLLIASIISFAICLVISCIPPILGSVIFNRSHTFQLALSESLASLMIVIAIFATQNLIKIDNVMGDPEKNDSFGSSINDYGLIALSSGLNTTLEVLLLNPVPHFMEFAKISNRLESGNRSFNFKNILDWLYPIAMIIYFRSLLCNTAVRSSRHYMLNFTMLSAFVLIIEVILCNVLNSEVLISFEVLNMRFFFNSLSLALIPTNWLLFSLFLLGIRSQTKLR